MRSTVSVIAAAVCLACLVPHPALAETTRVTVRVLSKDAKFVGTSMGGARVTIKDADTGEVLAQGVTRGGSGSTDRIMKQPHRRGEPISTEDSARYTAVLDIQEPRRLEISARGPLAQIQSMTVVSATQWVVPGRHLDQGDAVLLVMPGLSLDVLAPPAHTRLQGVPQQVTLRVNLTML